MTDTLLTPDTDEILDFDPGQHAHIVKTNPNENAAAKVLQARIEGTPIEALCGYVWVPSKDPKNLPVCPKCMEVYQMYRMANDGLNDTPGM